MTENNNMIQPRVTYRRICEIGTCTAKHYARGVCRRHYQRAFSRTATHQTLTLEASLEAVKGEERVGGAR